jgi:hypothetical protein
MGDVIQLATVRIERLDQIGALVDAALAAGDEAGALALLSEKVAIVRALQHLLGPQLATLAPTERVGASSVDVMRLALRRAV